MASQVVGCEFVWSAVRRKEVQKSLIYSDGFVYLEGDPQPWIQRNLPLHQSVRSLELCDYDGEKIGDFIAQLSELTHLSIRDSASLKCMTNVLRLHNLQVLRIIGCENLEELPQNFGELRNLTHLELSRCKAVKSLPNFASLRNLQRLYLGLSVEELSINLNELPQLLLLDISWCYNIKYLPCNMKNLLNLQFLLLPWNFRLETLPLHLNDSVIISVESRHIRKTWKELKLDIGPLIVGASLSNGEMVIEAAQNHLPIFPLGYLSLKEDPSSWFLKHYNLRFLVRILDLELPSTVGQIGDFIGTLPNLTHLYISAAHYFQFLGKLSNLKSLDLCVRKTKFPAVALDLPFCLEHLTLRYCDCYSLPDSVAKLSNLNTLELYRCNQVSMPENLNLTKLKLVCCSVEPLPPSLCFLEIVHDIDFCFHECGDDFKMCLKQLVNLKTLSLTCYSVKLLPIIAGQQGLKTLLFKNCYNFRELMPNMDELVELCTLNISGTRIKSLPECITKLPKLQHLVLPKCFTQTNLPHQFLRNESIVKVEFDVTDEIYYKNNGYCRSFYESSTETSDEDDETSTGCQTSGEDNVTSTGCQTSGEDNVISTGFGVGVGGVVRREAGEEDILTVQTSSCRLPNPPEATQGFEGENSNHASRCLQNQEMEAGDLSLYLQGGLSINFGENGEIGIGESDITSPHQLISSSGVRSSHNRNNHNAIVNAQNNNNPHGVYDKKGNRQKKEITREEIQSLRDEHMTLIEAAKKLGVSRSTLKRRCKELSLVPWPSSRKKKSKCTKKRKLNPKSPSGDEISQTNLLECTNPPGPEYVNECLDVNQRNLSDQVAPECDSIDNTTPPNAKRKSVGEFNVLMNVQGSPPDCMVRTDVHPLVGNLRDSSSSLDIKATYKEDIVRFKWSSSAGLKELKEAVVENLKIEFGSFKLKYLDEEEDWVLINTNEHLTRALSLTKNNILRLKVTDL